MNVSQATKDAFKDSSIPKSLTMRIYKTTGDPFSVTIPMSNIVSESMTLEENLVSTNSIEFVGCIASKFSIQIHGSRFETFMSGIYVKPTKFKGANIEVSIIPVLQGHTYDSVPLFHGVIDSCQAQANRQFRNIVAYDELYTKGNEDVADWYNGLTFPITLKNFRDSLFNEIGITQVSVTLPNDSVQISKQYVPKTLNALNVIKAICQINGAMGIIGRDGNFDYRFLDELIDTDENTNDFVNPTELEYYKKVMYEDWKVKGITKVVLRESEDDANPITVGTGSNKYIVQSNILAYKLNASTKTSIATNILNKVKGFQYVPFSAENYGCPYLEVGKDAIQYQIVNYD